MRFLHRVLRDMHGAPGRRANASDASSAAPDEDIRCCYADYASAVANANAMLQRHGAQSAQFTQADIASMRMFHRVKKLQGIGKPVPDRS